MLQERRCVGLVVLRQLCQLRQQHRADIDAGPVRSAEGRGRAPVEFLRAVRLQQPDQQHIGIAADHHGVAVLVMHEPAAADDRLLEALDGAPPGFLFQPVGGGLLGLVPGLPEHRIAVTQGIDPGPACADQLDRARHIAGFSQVFDKLLLPLGRPSLLFQA